MSVVPYVAPWQADFERFSTQLVAPPIVAGASPRFTFTATVNEGQWWRIIYAYVAFSTDATAGHRTALIEVQTPSMASPALKAYTPLLQAPSSSSKYLWFPGAGAFANTSIVTDQFGSAPLPDVVWPQGAKLSILLLATAAGDTLDEGPVLGVEVYTERTGGVLAPAATPAVA